MKKCPVHFIQTFPKMFEQLLTIQRSQPVTPGQQITGNMHSMVSCSQITCRVDQLSIANLPGSSGVRRALREISSVWGLSLVFDRISWCTFCIYGHGFYVLYMFYVVCNKAVYNWISHGPESVWLTFFGGRGQHFFEGQTIHLKKKRMFSKTFRLHKFQGNFTTKKNMHSLKPTARPWELIVGRLLSFGMA